MLLPQNKPYHHNNTTTTTHATTIITTTITVATITTLTQVEVEDEHMLQLIKNNLSQLSLGQGHYLSGWVDKTKIMQCHLLTEVVVEVYDELGNYSI